jgi:amino acid transporter
MVVVSFGSYASDAVAESDEWVKPFAVLLLLVMAVLNIVGANAVARAQIVVVVVLTTIVVQVAFVTLVLRTLCGLRGVTPALTCAHVSIHTLNRNSTTSPSCMT